MNIADNTLQTYKTKYMKCVQTDKKNPASDRSRIWNTNKQTSLIIYRTIYIG